MAFSPITAWQIERARVEAVTDFLFSGSNITADGDCSHEIRRWLLLGRKVMTNLDSVLKCRNITLPTKICQKVLTKTYRQGYGLPIGHIRLWALDRKAGRTPKNWCLWTVVLKKTLESPLDSKRSNQSILREVNPEYSLEGLILKLRLQLFWSSDVYRQLNGKVPDAGKDWG